MALSANLIKTQSATSGITSTYLDLGDYTAFAVEVSFSGSDVAGTLTLEACASDTAQGFVTVASSSTSITASGTGLYNVTGAGYRYIRVKWAYTSGTGNITANIYVKRTVSVA